MDGTSLLFSIISSFIGMAYFAYGKKQNGYFAMAGVLLMLYPYAVSSLFWLIVIGAVLAAAPFALSRYY